MKFVPRDDIQAEGVEFMLEKSFAGLFWDPGRGKTPVTLKAYNVLRDAGYVKRMLVAASVNIIYDVWPEQIEKFDDFDLSYIHVHGSEKQRHAAMEMDADVYLTNYENIEWLVSNYRKRMGIDMLTVDESSKFRNRGTRRFAALRKVLKEFKRRYILTGSPIPRGYMNLWTQMMIVDLGESLGDTITRYRNQFFYPSGFMGYDWELRDGAEEDIWAAISHRIHRAERNVNVPIEFIDLPVRLPPKAMAMYREFEREFISEWRGKTLLAQNAAAATVKLRQAANGAVYYDAARRGERRKFVVVHDRKVIKLAELVDDLNRRGNSLLTAYEFDHDHQLMLKAGMDVPSYSAAKRGAPRTELKEALNRGELGHLAGQIQSISHGLNLQEGCHNCAYYGLPWSLDDYEQLYQRVWRDDQRHGCKAYRLIAEGTIDETVLEVLQGRDQTQQAMLKALKRRYKL